MIPGGGDWRTNASSGVEFQGPKETVVLVQSLVPDKVHYYTDGVYS